MEYDYFLIMYSYGGNVVFCVFNGDDDFVEGFVCLNMFFFNVLDCDFGIFENVGMFIVLVVLMVLVGFVF